MRTLLTIVGATLLVLFIIGISLPPSEEEQQRAAKRAAATKVARVKDNSAAAAMAANKAARAKELKATSATLIDQLTTLGVFQKVLQSGRLPQVWVRPAFYLEDFDVKHSMIATVFNFYYPSGNSDGLIILYDSRSGKKVGTFDSRGLEME